MQNESLHHRINLLLNSSPATAAVSSSSSLGSDSKNCRPWSRSDFLARLATFQTSSWFNKPSLLSPVECARFGWVNDGVDILHCNSCDAYLSGTIQTGLDANSGKQFILHSIFFYIAVFLVAAVAAKLHSQLNESHQHLCPWRDNCSGTDIVSVLSSSETDILADFAQRQKSLLRLERVPRLHSSFVLETTVHFFFHIGLVNPFFLKNRVRASKQEK